MQSINTWQNATDSYCAKMSVLITGSEISSVSLKIDDWNIGFITVYVDHQAFFRVFEMSCIFFSLFQGNNIFQSLSPAQYRNVIKMLEHAILSTDLALYFK